MSIFRDKFAMEVQRNAVTTANGDSDVTLIGLEVTFRGHPENKFRLLGMGFIRGWSSGLVSD